MGAIYKRKDGRWACTITIEGERKTLYGQTPEEVAARRDETLRAVRVTTQAGSELLSDYLATWLEQVVKTRNRPSTYRSYEQIVRVHIVPALGHIQLCNLKPVQVQQMLNDVYASGRSARTTQYVKRVLQRALNQALKWESVTRNVVLLVDAPRAEKFEASVLTEEQIEGFFKAVRGHRLEGLYWLALLGMRKGELIGLEWKTVDLERGTLRIVQGKTAASARTLPLSATLVSVLRRHAEQQQAERRAVGDRWQDYGMVFPSSVGTPLNPRNLTHHFKKTLKQAGLPDIRFHDLRHTAATIMLEQGQHPKVVQMVLGHATINMTMNIYSHVSLKEKVSAVESLEGLFGRVAG
jgi:integrase